MRWYWWLLVVIAALAGISTVIPMDASKDCYLGYEAHCTFTPISTIICIVAAIALMFIGGMTDKKVRDRVRDWADEEEE